MGRAILDTFKTEDEAKVYQEKAKKEYPNADITIYYEPDYLGTDEPYSVNIE